LEQEAKTMTKILDEVLAANAKYAVPTFPGRKCAFGCPIMGARVLPLLSGIMLNDDESPTYKAALLRSIARIADLLTTAVQFVQPPPDSEIAGRRRLTPD
jgi:hypothetical protein